MEQQTMTDPDDLHELVTDISILNPNIAISSIEIGKRPLRKHVLYGLTSRQLSQNKSSISITNQSNASTNTIISRINSLASLETNLPSSIVLGRRASVPIRSNCTNWKHTGALAILTAFLTFATRLWLSKAPHKPRFVIDDGLLVKLLTFITSVVINIFDTIGGWIRYVFNTEGTNKRVQKKAAKS